MRHIFKGSESKINTCTKEEKTPTSLGEEENTKLSKLTKPSKLKYFTPFGKFEVWCFPTGKDQTEGVCRS